MIENINRIAIDDEVVVSDKYRKVGNDVQIYKGENWNYFFILEANFRNNLLDEKIKNYAKSTYSVKLKTPVLKIDGDKYDKQEIKLMIVKNNIKPLP
jgi:hypothetical protein